MSSLVLLQRPLLRFSLLRIQKALFFPAQLLQFNLPVAFELLLLQLQASRAGVRRRRLPGSVELPQLLRVQVLQTLQVLQMQAVEFLLLPEVARRGRSRLLNSQGEFIGPLLAFD